MAHADDKGAQSTKEDLQQALQKFQILGVVIAGVVGLATVSKSVVDAHSAAIKDTRDQIASAEQFYMAAADRAVSIKFSTNTAAPALLRSSLDQVLSRPPSAFHPPMFSGDLENQGQQRLCAARNFAIAQHFAAVDEATRADFTALATSAVEKAPRAWARCPTLIRKAAEAGVKQQEQVAVSLGASPPARLNQLNAAAPDTAKGLTIDSFYCGDPGGRGYRDARAAGDVMAGRADGRQPLVGSPLGLIRLRPAPVPAVGDWVVYDPDEKAFAEALKTLIDRPGRVYGLAPNGGSRTRFYLGVYSCTS